MKYFTLIAAIFLLLITGCKEQVTDPVEVNTAPSAPRGLATYPGDGFIEIDWFANPERDVAYYRVYASRTENGTFQLIGKTDSTFFIDNLNSNGEIWFYSVSAVDLNGLESSLSPDIYWEIARPEGRAVINDYHNFPTTSGFDFSTDTRGLYTGLHTDVYFEYYDGFYYMDARTDCDIQDLGYTSSFYSINELPTQGWSPTKDVRLIIGHTYAVRTWDNHYAKFRVFELTESSVTFDWAYQLQTGISRLKTTVVTERAPFTLSRSALDRAHK